MKTRLTVLFFGAALLYSFGGSARAAEVAFEPDHNLPVVYLNVAIRAGSVADPKDQAGLTNFMGEMLLRGTKQRSKEQLDLAIDQIGATLAVETRPEAMIIRGSVLASQLDPFLDLLSEIITQPAFPDREIRKLKSEVSSGILQERGNDQTLAGRKFVEFLFRDHPYGNPVLGKIKSVEKFDVERIRAQYGRLVTDKLLLVVGTGDTSLEKIATWSNTLSAKIPSGAATENLGKIPRPENAPNRRLVIVDKPDRTQTQITAGQIGIRPTDKDFFPLFLGNHAFGGGSFSARMMMEIRVKRGWSYGAYSYFRNGTQPKSWQFYLFPASKDTVAALGYSLGMVETLKANGIKQEEFDFAKQSLVNSSGFMFNTTKKRVENKLNERTLDLPDGFFKSYGPELQKVSLNEVNSALKAFIKPDQLAIVVVATAKDMKTQLAKAAGVPEEQVQVVSWKAE